MCVAGRGPAQFSVYRPRPRASSGLFASGDGGLSLPEPIKGAMLPSKPPGIRMSA